MLHALAHTLMHTLPRCLTSVKAFHRKIFDHTCLSHLVSQYDTVWNITQGMVLIMPNVKQTPFHSNTVLRHLRLWSKESLFWRLLPEVNLYIYIHKYSVPKVQLCFEIYTAQEDDLCGYRPGAYFSKKHNRYQQAYTTIGKEAFILALAMQHFIFYSSSGQGDGLHWFTPLFILDKFNTIKNLRISHWCLVL